MPCITLNNLNPLKPKVLSETLVPKGRQNDPPPLLTPKLQTLQERNFAQL